MRNICTHLVSGFLFPLHERLKQHTSVNVRKSMEQTQWLSPGEIVQLQTEKLRQLLIYANIHVPYYRDLFVRLNFQPEKLDTLADLQQLPFLDKPTIRMYLEELKSDQACHLARFNTGGSSGEPLVFFIGKERVSHDIAAKWRATRWWGMDIGDPEIVIWGSPIELGAQDALRTLRDRLFRSKLLPAFEMSNQKIEDFLNTIRKFRPKMLFGYPSALSHIAKYADKTGIIMSDLDIEVAFVTSERLYDDQRKQISDTFGCRVANGYGGRDAGFIAHECPAGRMHITAEDIVVEIIDPHGRSLPHGESGEIVVTHLASRDFPFIRYRTGDIGILDDEVCACGRGLPLIKEIQGRNTDFIVARDGTVMHGLALIYILRDMPQIKTFKIIQESMDFTRVLLITEDGLSQVDTDRIIVSFQARLGRDVIIAIEQVSEIPTEKSGKFRYVVSKVTAG
ncbi:phenylacetate--CoA ligase family protein [Nitrosomonas sp. HPC101]|uniref:phenylacetate--CoA ligase family protein n=1 Tax=Nitrosomonas sp. HPC101 TaxID=1658667 RepID=UPI001368CF3E|nr:AMP-binding protein [Nitrosomonas sp. HPC101]MXS84922.1 phenylacetate--CoA ligase family protein [Nitrosomonas sp. HPC101]